MLVSPRAHSNWECRDGFSERVCFAGASFSFLTPWFALKKEMEKPNCWEGGEQNQPTDLSKIPAKALNCCPFLPLAECVTAKPAKQKPSGSALIKVLVSRGRRWTGPGGWDLSSPVSQQQDVLSLSGRHSDDLLPPGPLFSMLTQPHSSWVPPVRTDGGR